MSGRSEERFWVDDSRLALRLGETAVLARRVGRLFSVEVALAPPAGGEAQGDRGNGCWVNVAGASDRTERAKDYILSVCEPAVVRDCHTDQQSVEQLLSETSKLRDNLEREFSTTIFPGRSPSSVSVQGTSEPAVVRTIERIQAAMAPPDLPQPQPFSSSSSSSPPLQSRLAPPSTAGTFSPSPPPPEAGLASTDADLNQQMERVSPHRFPSVPSPSTQRLLPATEREKIVQRIAYEIEHQRDADVISRGVDSSHREQTVHYFLSLNFPRERIETVVDSMGPLAETDDILKRLNSLHVTTPRPVATLSVSRNYTTDGEPVLNSNAALRPVVIDGSNIAMRHGNGRVFSCRGIQIAVDWFRWRGHKEITVFVPQWRKETPRAEYPITDQDVLNQLEREGTLKFTPSRRIGNKKIVCYDDRFIVRLASETNGVIVSNDNFRDLAEENEKWRKTIENRLVMFTFVNDIFMVPEDPLGKYGPRLSQLLQLEPTKSSSKGGAPLDQPGPAVCPYGERCTFGRRCRFSHPEREGRLDPTLLTSRSPNTSPAPSEKRHADNLGDVVQKDGTGSSERGSPSGPSGQPTSHSSPQKPWTCPAQSDMSFNPQPSVPHGYSQPQAHPAPSGYSPQPLSSENHHYSHSQPHQLRDYVQPPQYLGLPASHSNSLSPPPPHSSGLQSSPLHSGPSTPISSGVSYPSRTFPIANLSMGFPRSVTDRLTNGSIANGGDEFLPTAPNARPIIPPHHQHGMEPLPGLVPRGDYPPPAQFQVAHHQPSYNWASANGGYHHPAPYHLQHTPNTFQPSPHAYVPSGEQIPSQRMVPHRSPGRNPHSGDYPVAPHGGHLPQSSNAYQNLPSSENGPYLHEHSVVHRGGHPDYRYHHHKGVDPQSTGQGPRASSMYGDMGMRLHHDKVSVADKFQSSQSSPELYRDTRPPHRHQQQQQQARPSLAGGGGGGGINWTLFKQAQARLFDREDEIMKTMMQHPQADLERLVEIIQRSW